MLRIEYTSPQNNRSLVVYTPNSGTSNSRSSTKATPSDSLASLRSARSRAFNRCQRLVWFNTDLTVFTTLTYKRQHKNYKMILDDIKNIFTRNGTKYIAVVERHKTGNFHIHAIIDDTQPVESKRLGKVSLKNWHKGWSDVKYLKDTDENFNVALYMLKYINKSEKIGGRYFLSSRNLISPIKDSKVIGSSVLRPADNKRLSEKFINNDLQFSQFHTSYSIPNYPNSAIIKIYK